MKSSQEGVTISDMPSKPDPDEMDKIAESN